MNWFKILKHSALEDRWWIRFYEHLSGAAKYTFPDIGNVNQKPHNPTDWTPRLDPNGFSSGIDGSKLFFSLIVIRKGHDYRGGVTLEFNQSLNKTKMQWKGAKLLSMEANNSIQLIKSGWSVIRDFHDKNNFEVVGQGIFAPNQSTPINIIERIKEAILKDGEDGGNENGFQETPKPPSKKMPLPVEKSVNQLASV